MGWWWCGLGSGSGLRCDVVHTHRHRPQLLGGHEVGEQQRVAAEAALRDALELLHLPALPRQAEHAELVREGAQRRVAHHEQAALHAVHAGVVLVLVLVVLLIGRVAALQQALGRAPPRAGAEAATPLPATAAEAVLGRTPAPVLGGGALLTRAGAVRRPRHARHVEAAVDDEWLVEHVLGECVVSLAHELETLRRRLTRRARAREIGWGV